MDWFLTIVSLPSILAAVVTAVLSYLTGFLVMRRSKRHEQEPPKLKIVTESGRELSVGEVVGHTTSRETANIEAESTKLEKFREVGINDPDVDLWLAVIKNDVRLLQDALERGANPNVTLGDVLSKHS